MADDLISGSPGRPARSEPDRAWAPGAPPRFTGRDRDVVTTAI